MNNHAMPEVTVAPYIWAPQPMTAQADESRAPMARILVSNEIFIEGQGFLVE
jgi:hypothetical protein